VISLHFLWDLIRGNVRPPPVIAQDEVEQVAKRQDDMEPLIQDLERAAAFRKWERERASRRS